MARPQWPVTLNPLPLREGYSFRPHDDILRTDMEGYRDARRLHGESDLFPTLRLPMSATQYAEWQAFWADDLRRGVVWFDMPIRIGAELSTRVVRAASYEAAHSGADWLITMEVEVRDPPFVPFLTAPDFWFVPPALLRGTSVPLAQIEIEIRSMP